AGGQARVYTITHDEAARNTGTMSGMLSVFSVPVFALCDPGATLSFISSHCLEALSISTVHSCDPLEVSRASGKIIISDSVVRNLSICIGGRVLEADMYVIEMRDFDVILGMDWLTRYRADIRTVPRVIFSMQARKSHSKGSCQGYLVSLVSDVADERVPKRVSIICEYLDVFPDDLPGGPPDRQVEFTIDLIPGAGPVSKASYRIAPKELQELKAQIQELLKLGFIRPSVSPWGAPVLFMMVRGKFLPQSFWDRMEHEFYHLQQGSSTVDEYIRTFTRMCLFADDAVNTDPKKARKFFKGLNQRIRELVGSHGLMSFADTVSRAQEVESCLIPIAS
ncbi:Unknown protein, partial [Striga hermonthica]